jgi:hypothetical protein
MPHGDDDWVEPAHLTAGRVEARHRRAVVLVDHERACITVLSPNASASSERSFNPRAE